MTILRTSAHFWVHLEMQNQHDSGRRSDTADIQLESRLLGGLAAAEPFQAGEANVHMHIHMLGLHPWAHACSHACQVVAATSILDFADAPPATLRACC